MMFEVPRESSTLRPLYDTKGMKSIHKINGISHLECLVNKSPESCGILSDTTRILFLPCCWQLRVAAQLAHLEFGVNLPETLRSKVKSRSDDTKRFLGKL